MADPQHKVVKLPSGEVIAFPGSMPDAHVAGLITAFRQGKFNSPESGQVHTGNLHAQVGPVSTEGSEHSRQLKSAVDPHTVLDLPPSEENSVENRIGNFAKGTVSAFTAPALHPVQTAQAMGEPFVAAGMAPGGMYPATAPLGGGQTGETSAALNRQVQDQAQQDVVKQGAEMKQHPAYTAGMLLGPIVLHSGIKAFLHPTDIPTARFRSRVIHSGPMGDVRVGTDRIPTIWMHPKAWDSLMGVLYPGENPGESHGMSLGADHNLLKLAQDRGLSQTPEFKEVQTMLEKAHREAQGQADSVAIGVKRGKGIQYAVRAMREERNHAWQRSLSQNKSIYTHLSPQGFDDVKKSIPGSMSAHLEFEGYDANSAPEMVSESAARFIGGELRGSTPEEAGEFLDKYFQQAVKEHGPKALETLEHVRGEGAKAKERINAEHNASQQGATRTGVPEVATGRQGGAGATPEGGTGQTGTTAPEVTFSREINTPVVKKEHNGVQLVDSDFTHLDEPDEFYYHVTTAPTAKKILQTGEFKPSSQHTMAAGFYRNYSKGKVFFADRNGVSFWQERIAEHLDNEMDNPPPLVVLRVPKSTIGDLHADELGERDSYANSWYSDKSVHVKPVETDAALNRRGKPRERAQEGLAVPYKIESAVKTDKPSPYGGRHYDGSPNAEIWTVKTDAGDVDVFVHPGGGEAEAEQQAAMILGQNIARGVPAERLFNPGTYKPTEAINAAEINFRDAYQQLRKEVEARKPGTENPDAQFGDDVLFNRQKISPQEAKDKKMFGPVFHGTTAVLRDKIGEEGFKVFEGEAESGDIRHGYGGDQYGNTGVPPPVHHLGYGVYLTTVRNIAKKFNEGSGRGLRSYYINAPRIAEINFGSPRTMMKWWTDNGYNPKIAMRDRVVATKILTETLKKNYDAVWFKGKGIRTLLDGDQIVVFNPDNILEVDNTLTKPGEIGSKVTRKSDGMKGVLVGVREIPEGARQYHKGNTRFLEIKWQKGGKSWNDYDPDVEFEGPVSPTATKGSHSTFDNRPKVNKSDIAFNRQHENDDDLIGAKEAHRLFKERAAAAGINTSGGFIDGYSSNYMPINENLPNQTSANGWTVEPSIRFSDHSPANYRPTFSNWQGGTRAEFNKWADETIRDISDLRSGNLDAVNQRNDARRYAALQNAADYWRSRGDENAARSIERDIAKQQQKSQKIKSSDHALNRERPESGEAYEKLSRLRINSDLGQENTAALVTPKGKVLVGDWHTELYKESGYGDKGGEAKFFKEGGVRIRAQNNESHIEFSQIDPATVERVTNAIHALPGREVTLEYMPLGLGKGTLFSLGDKTRALSDLSMWARRGDRSAPQYGSAAYWHQQGDAAFNRQNPWYLKSERLISEKMRGPMPADDLQKMLQAGGIKEDEMKWTGLDEFLKSKGKEKVTPDQVRDYITKNSLQVKEVMRRTGGLKPTMAQEDAIVLWAAQHDTDRRANSTWYKDDAGSTIPTVKQAFHDIRQGRLEEGVGNLEMLGVPDDLLEPFRNYAGGEENVPRFGGTNLVLPGGQNYKELLFELPKSKPVLATESADREYREWVASVAAHHGWDTSQWPAEFQAEKEQRLNQFTLARHEEIHASHANTFRTTHWPSNENVVGHLRFNDRTGPNGEKLLHVEEVQSDWHQKGRKQGYANPLPQNIPLVAERKGPSWFEVRTDAGEFVTNVTLEHAANEQTAIAEARRRMREDPTHTYQHRDGRVPDAPWKKTWHEMLLRRMVQYAAQNGYDGVTWTPGAAQAERYDLSQHIDSLRYSPYGNGTFEVDAVKDGHIVQSKIGTPQQLEEFVGKDVVQKITNGEGRDWYTALGTTPSGKELVGVDLKVGGEGMHGFYDKIVPDYLNKFGKKWGSKVGTNKIIGGGVANFTMEPVGPESTKWEVISPEGKVVYTDLSKTEAYYRMQEEANKGETHEVPYLPITPEMRDSLVREGVPMFNREKDPKLDSFMHDLWGNTSQNPFNNRERVFGDKGAVEMWPFNGRVHLSFIRSFDQGKGYGSEILKNIIALADKHGVTLELTVKRPKSMKGLSNADLKKWYGRYGFKKEVGDYMVREPLGDKNSVAPKQEKQKEESTEKPTFKLKLSGDFKRGTFSREQQSPEVESTPGVVSTGSTKTIWSAPSALGALKSQVLQQSPHKVEAPDGKTYVFPDLDSLNNFRNEAGIK